MRKILGVLLCFFIFLVVSGCSSLQSSEPEYWGSFTNGPVISSDGLYRAEHAATKQDGSDIPVIQVNVYDTSTNELLDSFIPARAMDFWGICWEEGTRRIWIQSADIGIYCYELQNGHWVLNEDIERPNTIVSKWDAK
ncbi:MAG: hypothetical protein IKB78_09720 [Clostridia bacterium]|nr:hypothetical protein [Clostridia bacterium]